MEKLKNRKLSVYLIKDDVLDYADVIKPGAVAHNIESKGVSIGTLFMKPIVGNTPAWVALFEGSANPELSKGLKNSNVSAVLMLKQNGRIFAVTFGYGRALLKRDTFEDRFGLMVVLNSIDQEKIRVIERKNLDTMFTQTRTQTSRTSAIGEFGVDVDKVLLKAVQGEPRDAAFASIISGADSLSITCPISLENLPAKCSELLEAFGAKRYQETFPWVDYMNEVRDPEKRRALNNQLVGSMQLAQAGTPNGDMPFMAVPDMVEWTNVGGFAFRENGENSRQDILMQDFLETVRSTQNISLEYLKHRKVYQIYNDSGVIDAKWSVYHCINWEVAETDKTYVLTEGHWYEVDPSFVSQVNTYVGRISKFDIDFTAMPDETEKDYNQRLYESDTAYYAHMDRNSIFYGGGHSQIEFCDLFTLDGKLVHVKRYSGSSALSHLFSQGVNCARALIADPDFVIMVNAKLPDTHKINNDLITSRNFEVVFAIISETADEIPGRLPFFSRITLMRTMKELESIMGVKTLIAGIQVV